MMGQRESVIPSTIVKGIVLEGDGMRCILIKREFLGYWWWVFLVKGIFIVKEGAERKARGSTRAPHKSKGEIQQYVWICVGKSG